MQEHTVPLTVIDSLASGRGDGRALSLLASGQFSKHLLLIEWIVRNAGKNGLRDAGADPEACFELLTEAQIRDAGETGAVLSHPHVGAWAASCASRLHEGKPARQSDVARLGAIAAAAGIRAGVDFTLTVAAERNLVLPSLGAVSADGPALVRGRGRNAEISTGRSTIHLSGAASADGPGWQPLHVLGAEHGELSLTVELDDLDAYRGGRGLRLSRRLDAHQVRQWQVQWEAAWRLLVRHHLPYAQALRQGLRTVVPLVPHGNARGIAATSEHAFGALAMTPPADPLQLAVGLVHEFQHAKLNALLYLIDLYRGDRPPRHYSPWRNDPRPLGGVLHGAYAYLAVADFWRTQRRHVDSELAATAEFEFRRWRGAVDRTVRAMRRTERFTSAGLRLLDGMQRALSQWPREVPAHPRLPVLAGDALEDHHALWRLRHLHPRSTAVAELCAAWRDSRPPRPEAPLRVECTLTAGDPGSQEDSERLLLVQRMLRDAGEPGLDGEVSPREAKCGPLGAGDAAYACGKADIAAHAYLAALAGDPESIEAWAGLTVAWRRTGRPEGKALSGAPELVRAVYVTLHASGRTPDVGALARWLGDAARTCAESW